MLLVSARREGMVSGCEIEEDTVSSNNNYEDGEGSVVLDKFSL